jgi:hypothetical protein
MQFHEQCATSVKTMFSQSIAQILPFCDNSHINRCGFSMPTKQFYFHQKRVETGDDILQILKMVENPSNSPHLEKNSFRALSSASCCKNNVSNKLYQIKYLQAQDSEKLHDTAFYKRNFG